MPIAIGWHSVGKEHYAEKRTRLKSHDIVVTVCDIIAVFDGCLDVCFMSTRTLHCNAKCMLCQEASKSGLAMSCDARAEKSHREKREGLVQCEICN